MEELIRLMSEMQVSAAKKAVAKNLEVTSLLDALQPIAAAFGYEMKDVLSDTKKLEKCNAALRNIRNL